MSTGQTARHTILCATDPKWLANRARAPAPRAPNVTIRSDAVSSAALKMPSAGDPTLRKTLTLNVDAPDYSLALPYRALASLYAHVNDFHSVLDSLKKAQQADPASAASTQLAREIQSVEQ